MLFISLFSVWPTNYRFKMRAANGARPLPGILKYYPWQLFCGRPPLSAQKYVLRCNQIRLCAPTFAPFFAVNYFRIFLVYQNLSAEIC